MQERSREYNAIINEKPKAPFSDEVEISKKLKNEGLEMAKSPMQFHTKKSSDAGAMTIYCQSKEDTISEQDVNKFLHIEWDAFQHFDELIQAVNSMRIVEFPNGVADWKHAKCTCKGYIKDFMCSHILSIAFRVQILKPDIHPDDEPLKPNKKKGRPKKSDKALAKN